MVKIHGEHLSGRHCTEEEGGGLRSDVRQPKEECKREQVPRNRKMQRKMNRREEEEWNGDLLRKRRYLLNLFSTRRKPIALFPSDRFPNWYPIPAYYQDPYTEAHFII